MNYYLVIMGICWLVFIIYWVISAFSAKRTIRGGWRTSLWIRLAIVVVLVFALQSAAPRELVVRSLVWTHSIPGLGLLGAILCIAGVCLAIWARTTLGANWGMPMAIKENRELVSTGPYAYIRHPIYAAVFLMMLGSACIEGIVWLIPFVAYFIYFMWAAKSEEKRLSMELPDQYPAYMARTKMIIPFVL